MSKEAKPWYYARLGCYYAWIDGKKTRLLKAPESPKNFRKAKQVLSNLLYESRHNLLQLPSGQTVSSVIAAYIEEVAPKLAKSTMAVRGSYLESFDNYCGNARIDECMPDMMQDWLDNHAGWSDWTKNGAVRNVQVAFNWAARKKITPKKTLIRDNPFRGITHRTGAPRRDMSQAEFQALLRASGGKAWKKPTPGARFRRILLYLWLTGCRPSEATALTWDHIDFERRLVTLKEHKTSRTQKRPMPRLIPLHPVLIKLLRWIKRQDEGHTVFLSRRRTAWDKDTLAQRVRRARRIANVPDDVKLYCTRHAFGTRGVLNGVDLKSLSAVMGNSVRTCDNYVHLAEKHSHLDQTMLKVNASIPRAPSSSRRA